MLAIASDCSRHGRSRDLEGTHEVALADPGDDLQFGGAQQHGAAVAGRVAVVGFEVVEVVGQAVVGLHGVLVADHGGVGKGEREGDDHGWSPIMYHRILFIWRMDVKRKNARESKKDQKTGLLKHSGGYRGSRSAHHVRKSEPMPVEQQATKDPVRAACAFLQRIGVTP